jgi:signal peptidase I
MKDTRKEDSLLDLIKVLAQALAIAVVFQTVLYKPFNIPSGSMRPTLLEGDYVFVSKFSYGYSIHSIPFAPPLFSGRILASQPERGDVVVFKAPNETSKNFIKRLVGLPGDEIQMIEGALHINGQPVSRQRGEDFVTKSSFGIDVRVETYQETLENGTTYTTLDLTKDGAVDNTPVYVVPEGHFFFMGDNRDNSQDSRYTQVVGFVPFELLVGRAEIIFFSVDQDTRIWEPWKWPTSIRWSRFFTKL